MIRMILPAIALIVSTDARISLLDGDVRSGRLIAINGDDVQLEGTSGPSSIPITEVMSIELAPAQTPEPPDRQQLLLTDGSRLGVRGLTRNAKETAAESDWTGAVRIPNAGVRAVRIQPDNPSFASQWKAFLERDGTRDLLIVAKRDGTGLDFLAGVVSAVSPEQIEFLLDGDSFPLPAARVYGIVFGRPTASGTVAGTAPAAVQIFGHHGEVLSADSISLADGKVQAATLWGQSLTLNTDRLQKIDMSGSRIAWLSELPTAEERFDGVDAANSLLAGLIDRDQQQALFGPKRNTTIERQSRISLRGRQFDRGLCIHSRTEMTWKLDGRYSRLESLVGIDDEVAFNGRHNVLLKITGDDRVLFEQLVTTTDSPLNLSLPLENVSTLRVLVDYGDGDSVCDWLDLADARLVFTREQR